MKRFKLFILFLAAFAFLVMPAMAGTPSTAKKNAWTAEQVFKNGVTIDNTPIDIFFPMAGWAIDGGDDIDEGSTPDIGDDDNIPSITWDNSGETTAIQQTFRLPGDSWTQAKSLTIYAMISSDTDVSDAGILDWRIWVNRNGVVFDATAIEQTAVTASATGNLSTTHEVLTLTLDATGLAAIKAGDFITLDLFNASTHATGNLELKGVHGIFKARQQY